MWREIITKVLNIKPIEHTTYFYPKKNSNLKDYLNKKYPQHFKIPHVDYVTEYNRLLEICLDDFVGPLNSDAIFHKINQKYFISDFKNRHIPVGIVACEYMRFNKECLTACEQFQEINETLSLSELEFEAYQKLKNRILDLELIDTEIAESIKRLLPFIETFIESSDKPIE